MKTKELIEECTKGGPGLDGYAYCADVYCEICAHDIIVKIAKDVAPKIADINDPLFSDSQTLPQPIFFGESDCIECCANCFDYLYGELEE